MSNFVRITLSVGILAIIQSWEILSKQPWMSASSTHSALAFFAREMKHCPPASAVERSGLTHKNSDRRWFAQRVPTPTDIKPAWRGISSRGRSARTAQVLNEHLGWAEIRHPFHPLKGQRFPVLKTRRVGGVDTLLLGHAERGSFSIASEWTDWGTPSVHDGAGVTACRFDLDMLLELIDLIDQLAVSASKKSSTKGA